MTTSDGTVAYDGKFELLPDETYEFKIENPISEYTIDFSTESGRKESFNWDVGVCSNEFGIFINPDKVMMMTSSC